MTMPLFADPAATDDLTKATSLLAVARAVADRLDRGATLSRQMLSQLMREQFGESDASGIWSMRDAYDALETAQVLLALSLDTTLIDWTDPVRAWSARAALACRLPTQTYRSERQVDLQQFSTPLSLAWMAACMAQLRESDICLEPSAGTGMLAVHAARRGARLILNERDPLRAALLGLALETDVSQHDAEYIDDRLGNEERPSAVLINPPFSRTESRGRDRHAGARHLRSALLRLADNGRCVAIMSPAFAQDGSAARGYETVCDLVPPRFEITVNGQPYARHGTSIAVRLLIYDKGWTGTPERFVAGSLAEAFPLLDAVPARLDDPETPPAVPIAVQRAPWLTPHPRPAGGLLAAVKPRKPDAPEPIRVIAGEPEPLAYDLLAEPPAADDPIGIYVPWRLTRMRFPDARPHPETLVESMAMSSILPPVPSYRPLLPRHAVAALSEAQLEAIVYAGQSFERDLPGRFRPNEAGTLLSAHAEGHIYRCGFMIGDGTGVGKGREIAGAILDRWCRGQRRAVWISKSANLLEDARRDWSALGGIAIDIQPLDAFPPSAPITMESGIMFLTFATLRSQRHDAQSRLQQIIAWLGSDFDGLIVFDEAHELANAAGTDTQYGTQKGSDQGLAGVRLQNLLPRACVLYTSATGATVADNLCYASRLRLWGNAVFETREAFMAAIADGGIAAMEIVARDLKALGFYMARALTFQGVEYDRLEHKLSPEQIEIYDAYADAWALIHRNLDAVLEATNIVDRMTGQSLNAQAKGAALSRFESAKQRFFLQLLIAMKLPTLVAAIERDIADARHVVVQLVTTAEAMLDRQLASLSADERAHLEIELSPREYM